LFGSYATDDYVPGSDVDIAVRLTEKRQEDEQRTWDIAEQFHRERYVSHPSSTQNDSSGKKVDEGFSFYLTVEEQGVKL
jgi:hypothetical protein